MTDKVSRWKSTLLSNPPSTASSAVIGTDLVLTIGSRPMIRLDGMIHEVDNQPVVDESLMDQYLADLLDGDHADDLERNRDEDFAFSYGIYRFRGNAFYQRGLPAVSLRLIQSTIPTFDEIGLPGIGARAHHAQAGSHLVLRPDRLR